MPNENEDGSKDNARTRERTLFRGGVLSAFGERDYAFLWSGALISNIGTWVQTAALLWYVKNVLHSNSWVGAVNMANFLPVLFLSLIHISEPTRLGMISYAVFCLKKKKKKK